MPCPDHPGHHMRCVVCEADNIAAADAMMAEQIERPKREWLIRKSGYFYRPNRSGYTKDVVAAGLYTEAEARAEAAIEPDCMTAMHASEFAAPIKAARELLERYDFI